MTTSYSIHDQIPWSSSFQRGGANHTGSLTYAGGIREQIFLNIRR